MMNLKNMGSSDGRLPAQLPPAQMPLARQASVYSLTFGELQNTLGSLGKDFGSMNMDELLKNIWTAEESQAMAAALGSAGGYSGAGLDGSGAGVGLQRQGSLTLPRTLSQKTVDEVWKDVIRENGQGSSSGTDLHQQRQPTLGEMTLEEFLVRAGVVREDMTLAAAPRPIGNSSNTNNNTNSNVFYGELPNSNNNTGLALGFSQTSRGNGTVVANTITNASGANLAIPATGTRPYAAPLGNTADLGNPQGLRGGGIVGLGDQGVNNGLMPGMVGMGGGGITVGAVGSPANQISANGLGKGGDLSSLSPVPYVLSGGFRGRKSSGAVEKVVERRQRRMIKNRESAARSRARKQAYTMELEAEVAKLKTQNQELQKKQYLQAEITETQKNQVLEIINQQHGPKKRCLRRTLTGPW
ncbi:bZIP transcription factor TRAB1 isoform X1 [Phoenix dactylifera]|uniref:BZIP transcription factor TRAB1 isoform X1 n=1 Tax=Phoenix dactylifera TaxID=42345 RepID=A0A8B7CEH0_PHODC|nr:bZIP transcription factor TRAB1 isoform X1 [Phoenix dactylifera]XP_008797274.1 bZIP transcription factor TRAB1 isoform X1 [Phoenix dactylifera]XP_017699628.1 bZIP transcription factor TRAB1 isoform X1 [Phoenix dactylifera]